MYSRNNRSKAQKIAAFAAYKALKAPDVASDAPTSRDNDLSDQEIEVLTGISRQEYDTRLLHLAKMVREHEEEVLLKK